MIGKSNSLATLGGGCFWCVEAVFQRVQGVKDVKSGYAGGKTKNPTYESSCSGDGHAQVIQIQFDKDTIGYQDLVRIFFGVHDPTTLNRQGNDSGVQYRSIILYHDEDQKKIASDYIAELTEKKYYDKPIVTQLVPLDIFWPAEEYHQNYFNLNPKQGYVKAVVAPKVEKFQEKFKEFSTEQQ